MSNTSQPVGPFDCDVQTLQERASDLSGVFYMDRIVCELRARIEALEAQQQEQQPAAPALAPAPAGLSLIDELAQAIGDELSLTPSTLRPEARRVVTVIVRRLRRWGMDTVAQRLEQEAAR